MRSLIISLWAAGVLAQFGVSFTLAGRQAFHENWLLGACLIGASYKSIMLASALRVSDLNYRDWWVLLNPVDLVIMARLPLDAVRRISEHYPVQRLATYTTIIFTGVAAVVTLASSGLLLPPWWPLVSMGRHFSVACLVVLWGTWGFYDSRFSADYDTELFCRGLTALLALNALSGVAVPWYPAAWTLLTATCAPLAACWFWWRIGQR